MHSIDFHFPLVLSSWNVECLVCTPRTGTGFMATGRAVCGIHGKTVTRKSNDGKNFEKATPIFIYIYFIYIITSQFYVNIIQYVF